MNASRRRKLLTISKKLSKLQEKISELSTKLNQCIEEEQEYLENVPESFRETARYLEADDDFDDLNQMGMDLEDHAFDLESISEHLKIIAKEKIKETENQNGQGHQNSIHAPEGPGEMAQNQANA